MMAGAMDVLKDMAPTSIIGVLALFIASQANDTAKDEAARAQIESDDQDAANIKVARIDVRTENIERDIARLSVRVETDLAQLKAQFAALSVRVSKVEFKQEKED